MSDLFRLYIISGEHRLKVAPDSEDEGNSNQASIFMPGHCFSYHYEEKIFTEAQLLQDEMLVFSLGVRLG